MLTRHVDDRRSSDDCSDDDVICQWNINSSMVNRSSENEVYHLGSRSIDILISGYISPILVPLIVITNGLICIVLLQRHMRTPTNLLLVAMAVSDTLTGAFPIPGFLYFYTAGNYRDYVPYAWCYAWEALTVNLPTVCHTASIWLTVALAGQRYICVCHSHRAKVVCTIPNTVKAIVVIYVAAFFSQASRFFEYKYLAVEVESIVDEGVAFTGCFQRLIPFMLHNYNLYFSVYWWLRVIFIHLIPCASLVVLNTLLYHAMRLAHARRQLLLRQNRKSESRRLAETNMATLMLVVVVCVFLLVELPLAVLLITMIFENTFDWFFMDPDDRTVASSVINLVILFSYPLNFFIYCAMSRQFRETFKRLLTCKLKPTTGGAKAQFCQTTCQTTRI